MIFAEKYYLKVIKLQKDEDLFWDWKYLYKNSELNMLAHNKESKKNLEEN